MNTPLQNIALINGNLALTPDILGDIAYTSVVNALKLPDNASLSNCTMPLPPTANLAVVNGTLPSWFGIGSASVRLYLFEVTTLLGETERHANILFTALPTGITASALLGQFCAPVSGGGQPPEISLLSTVGFATNSPYLLFSTLDYSSSLYQSPPFPPSSDTSLTPALQAFVQAIQPELSQGYVFSATISLQATINIPVPAGAQPETLDLSTVLTALDLGTLCSQGINVIAQLSFTKASPQVNLLYPLGSALTPSGIPLSPSITAVGIGFMLGSGITQIPVFELDGSISLGSTPTVVAMSFQPYVNQLSVTFTGIPDFADLASHFTSGTSLNDILGNYLPSGVITDLGLLELVSLSLVIDCEALSVDALNFSLVTENPLALFDGITVQPALIVKLTNPFASYFSAEVDVAGKWFLKSSSLDTILMVEHGATPQQDSITFIANLSIGSGIDFLEIADALFHKQISGLPSLDISDIEIMAQRTVSGTTASDSVSISIDVNSGWNLDGIAIGLEDLSLNINFAKESSIANWEIQEVSAQGTLEIGPAFFNLSAEYDATDKSWTFTGGTVPGETENLGDFLTAVTSALGLDPPADFLSPFNAVNVTGCYLQYQTSSTGSASWQLIISTDFASGQGFNGMLLDEVVLSFSRNGTGTSFSLDATAPTPPTQGVGSLLSYLNSALNINVNLPAALTDSSIYLTGLSASYDTSTQSYSFVAYLNFGSSALVQLSIDIVSQTLNGTTTKTYELGGSLVFNPGANEIAFDLEVVESGGVSDMVASLQAPNGVSIHLGDLVKAIDPSVTGLDAFVIEIKNALFAHSGKNGATPAKSLFAIDMGAQVNLSKLGSLPIIGAELASLSSLDLAFQVIYATGGDYAITELQAINQSLGNPSMRFPEQVITAGSPSISTSIRVGSDLVIDMEVPVTLDSSGGLSSSGGNSITTPDSSSTSTDGNNGITWFPLNKTFGPVQINRVGLAFDKTNMAITGYLDGGVTVGPLTFDLMGLDVSIPLSRPITPSFGLQGLGLNYKNGPVDIGGALFRQSNNGVDEFDGFVTISTESLQIGAIGSFAEMNDGKKSLFVYAVLGEPLGGPAFFFVTGLAAGFGYNRQLLPPAISDVQNFPLITEAMTPAPQPQTGDLSGVHNYVAQQLALLQNDVVPVAGEYFFAAGIKFTSFKLVEGFLLAIIQFGNEFRIDFLGLANASLPPDNDTDPLAEAQLAVLAHYIPSEGSIWVQGQLTSNSFILSRNCHLTGGFAVACWTSGPYEGQFVTTIGGYAQGFQVPGYYPNPPQVGFNWQVSDDLNVKGGGYFALVPHALMAGGSLQATWQSGDVKAWFMMGADFLIQWKPFHYSADMYVDLGAELIIHFFGTHHVSIDVSADLNIWGPEFGGHARITIKVIGIHFHFSIDFGASSSEPQPLAWPDFQSSFLPADNTQWLGVNIQSGLVRTVQGTLKDGSTTTVWIVKRDELNITTSSVLPVNSVAFTLDSNTATVPTITPVAGIAPMAVKNIETSAHAISITRITSESPPKKIAATPAPSEQLMLVASNKKVPSGLWGNNFQPDLNPAPGTDTLDSVSGFSIVPSAQASEDPNAITVSRASLAYETDQIDGFTWVSDTGAFQGTIASWSAVETAIQTTTTVRAAALAKMGFINFTENFNQPLDRDAPVEASLGTWKN